MNVDVTITLSLEIPDALLSMSGKSAEDYVTDAINSADLPEWMSDAEITISADGAESDSNEIVSAPAPRAPKSAGTVTTTRVNGVPDAARISVTRPESGESTEAKRAGRPPLMRDWEASDGGPVTEWGKRSVQTLKDEGVACRKVGATAWPKWYVRAMESEQSEEIEPERPARKPLVAKPQSAPVAAAPAMRSRRTK